MNGKNFVEMELLLDVLNESGTVTLPVQGKSMLPFLKEGRDSVILRPSDGQYKKGDIVVYKRGNAYFMHRIISVGDGTVSIMGDNEINPDSGVDVKRIAAVVNAVKRGGKSVKPDSLLWKFYSVIYIKPVVRKFFLSLHKIRKD